MSFFQNYAPYNETVQDKYIYDKKYKKYKNKYLRQKKIMSGGGDRTQLHLVKADWCGHCKHFEPIWNKLSKQFNNKYDFVLHTEADVGNVTKKYTKIDGFPTVFLVKNSQVTKYEGMRDEESIIDFLKTYG